MKPESVRRLRSALEAVPGALRHDPIPEDTGVGSEPGIEIVISDATGGFARALADGRPRFDDLDDDGPRDDPAVIFEVPPEVTDAQITNLLGTERVGEIQRLFQLRGMDAIGAYLTFHQLAGQWGIYIQLERVVLLAFQYFDDVQVSLERKVELAFHAVLRHELFHFEVDCMVANWELATGVEVRWAASQKYRNTQGYIELEEGLANAYMLRGFKYPSGPLRSAPGAYRALSRFCSQQPAGYCDGPTYAKSSNLYLRECSQLSDDYHGSSSAQWLVPDEFDTGMLYPNPVQIDWTRCPIILQDQYDLQRHLGIHISYFRCVDRITETPSFERSLKKLSVDLQRQWSKVKVTLAITTAGSGSDFKRWKPGGEDCYSVRVGRAFRAHLRYERQTSTWIAEAIGDHKTMGHG
ncbi:MAG: hypothetical protein HYZ39_04870 [Mycolicibacterium cosmeticum]|nr:hypothetical protein [Mycolicibacterium cosmeticum]